MDEQERNHFKGNIALFRVCTIIFILVGLNGFVGRIVYAFMISGIRLSKSINEAISAITLVPRVMLYYFRMDSIYLACIASFSILLGNIALSKKDTTALKIFAVLMFIFSIYMALFGFLGDGVANRSIVQRVVNVILNANFVVVVAAFFVDSKKQIEESKKTEDGECINLGLLRLCASFFLISGLNCVVSELLTPPFSLFYFLLGLSLVVTSAFALIKENSTILMICSLILFVQFLYLIIQWSIGDDVLFVVVRCVTGFVFSSPFAVCIATFFVDPKRKFLFWKKE